MKRILTFVVSAALLAAYGCAPAPAEPGAEAKKAEPAEPKAAAELKIEDIEVGTDFEGDPAGWTAQTGDRVYVTYRGTLADGTVFDSNTNPGSTPFTFVLGAGMVIQGWDQGIVGMRKGGKRRLTIPPELGYGAEAHGAIPANSTLHFEVTLLDLVKKGEEGVFDKEDVKTGTGREARPGDVVTVHYVGTLVNGKQFDASRPRGEPFKVTLVPDGEPAGVIRGWNVGLVGVQKGTVRRLRIPPALAYGAQAPEGIGADQILLFEIEVLDVRPGGAAR
jgi:FKBP-type peptidyl-prolyl cis-trans isomerase